ncbi:hypothetical protein AB0M46_43010 [Dactylosporangium sp. NPDC051485]|uniref:hypothetical protein n=1 Tax=Dactylosporangium sp. NPDC051485 TaxID=3154846 RepID=UPI00343383C3
MRTKLLAVAALVAVALTGCAKKLDGPEVPAGPPEIHDAWTSCKDLPEGTPTGPAGGQGQTDALMLPRLPDDFAPAAVVVCAMEIQDGPGGAKNQARVERRATDVRELTAALRLPGLRPPADAACDLALVTLPFFAVLDAGGHWLQPGVAGDGCGNPRIEVRNALQHLHSTVVSSTVIGEIVSSAAAQSGCSQGYSDMVGTVTSEAGAKLDGPFEPATADVRLCVYTVPPSEQGSAKPGGNFERGGPLAAAAWAELRKAMLAAGPAAPCTAHAGRFAMFQPAGNGPGGVWVELDGCRRMSTESDKGWSLRQADAALIDRITRAA